MPTRTPLRRRRVCRKAPSAQELARVVPPRSLVAPRHSRPTPARKGESNKWRYWEVWRRPVVKSSAWELIKGSSPMQGTALVPGHTLSKVKVG